MVRAGRKAVFIDDFIDGEYVAIGWGITKSLSQNPTKKDVEKRLRENRPNSSDGSIGVWASQIVRFFNEISTGDSICTYDPNNRLYYIGEAISEVSFHDEDNPARRKVRWLGKIRRDALLSTTRNSLGAISTLFKIPAKAAEDMRGHLSPLGADTDAGVEAEVALPAKGDSDTSDLLEEALSRSAEYIEDLIAALSWEQMQVLTAEILKAMGYRTQIAPPGPDRGVDVFASPDGLGLQEPRIFVEVKHRTGTTIGSTHIRSFLGGRQPGDKCLYISTGGFSREAKYEAERSTIPITLIALPRLRELLVEFYPQISPIGAALVPLERIYWPA